jgi:hypothetical protein
MYDEKNDDMLHLPVVPAAPGTTAIMVTIYDEEDGYEPDFEEVPIVAWRILVMRLRNGEELVEALPVSVPHLAGNQLLVMELPPNKQTGKVSYMPLGGAGDLYDNISGAIEHFQTMQRIESNRRKALTTAAPLTRK